MELHLKFIGWVLVLLALIHMVFPKYFNWRKDLALLSLINKQMMLVHTFFIALTVLLVGVLCITSASELQTTNLGKKISLGLGIFWGLRLFFQIFIYSPKLWRGKSFETIVHIIFTLFWIYLTYTFFSIYFVNEI